MGEDTKEQKHSFRHFNNEKYQPIYLDTVQIKMSHIPFKRALFSFKIDLPLKATVTTEQQNRNNEVFFFCLRKTLKAHLKIIYLELGFIVLLGMWPFTKEKEIVCCIFFFVQQWSLSSFPLPPTNPTGLTHFLDQFLV